MSVKRYFNNGWLEDSEYGDLVHHADYESLERQLAEVQRSLAQSVELGNQMTRTIGDMSDQNWQLRRENNTLRTQLQAVEGERDRLRGLAIALCDHDSGWTESIPGSVGIKCCNICGQPRPHSGGEEKPE